ncbi:alpha/beta fold hydrolase [Nonomuraea fuscirosea]
MMSEEKAKNVGPSRIEMTYERFGDPQAPSILLIMGAGGQLVHWHEGFCAELAGLGHHVIRFDNRDAGLSTHIHDAPPPDLPAALAGDLSSASYTLSDLAADTVGLLDALGLDGAHLVGASLGGMIAQTVAVEHPARIRSLTSIMSTTGAPGVGGPRVGRSHRRAPYGRRTDAGAARRRRRDVRRQRRRGDRGGDPRGGAGDHRRHGAQPAQAAVVRHRRPHHPSRPPRRNPLTGWPGKCPPSKTPSRSKTALCSAGIVVTRGTGPPN